MIMHSYSSFQNSINFNLNETAPTNQLCLKCEIAEINFEIWTMKNPWTYIYIKFKVTKQFIGNSDCPGSIPINYIELRHEKSQFCNWEFQKNCRNVEKKLWVMTKCVEDWDLRIIQHLSAIVLTQFIRILYTFVTISVICILNCRRKLSFILFPSPGGGGTDVSRLG